MLQLRVTQIRPPDDFFSDDGLPPHVSLVFDPASGTHAATADDGTVTPNLNPAGPCVVCKAAPLAESCLVLVRGVPAVACPSCWEEAARDAG